MAVLDQVGSVLVETRVGDGQSDLVQLRGPRQLFSNLLDVHAPLSPELPEQSQGRVLHADRLSEIDVVAFDHEPDRVVPDVVMPYPAHQVMQHTLSHRPACHVHLVDRERTKDRSQDGQPAGKNGRSFGLQSRKPQPIDAAGVDQGAAQLLHGRAGDRSLGPALSAQDLAYRDDRAGRAEATIPTHAP